MRSLERKGLFSQTLKSLEPDMENCGIVAKEKSAFSLFAKSNSYHTFHKKRERANIRT